MANPESTISIGSQSRQEAEKAEESEEEEEEAEEWAAEEGKVEELAEVHCLLGVEELAAAHWRREMETQVEGRRLQEVGVLAD